MPAPDLGPPPHESPNDRPLAVHLLPRMVDPASLEGSIVVMIDALRASVTISAALASGAEAVFPVLTVEDALAKREELARSGTARDRILLGGERGGVLIPGFDLDNSPVAYTPEKVRGKTLIFTTANGTSTLMHAQSAARVVVGALTNLSALTNGVASDSRAVHVVCSGTRGEISLDDCLAAGAIVERLMQAGRRPGSDDSALVCLNLWTQAGATGLLEAMRSSRGGRNLGRLGFDADLRLCSTIDAIPVLPEYTPASGRISLASG